MSRRKPRATKRAGSLFGAGSPTMGASKTAFSFGAAPDPLRSTPRLGSLTSMHVGHRKHTSIRGSQLTPQPKRAKVTPVKSAPDVLPGGFLSHSVHSRLKKY
jgi:hypothetical protein